MLAWSTAMLASIPPAGPIKDFKSVVRRAATQADDERKGVVATLKYEKLPDMNQARMGHQTFATANGLVVVGGPPQDSPSPRRQKSTRTANGTASTPVQPTTTDSPSCSATAAG